MPSAIDRDFDRSAGRRPRSVCPPPRPSGGGASLSADRAPSWPRGGAVAATASPPGQKRTRRDGAIRPSFSDNSVVGHTRINRVDRRGSSAGRLRILGVVRDLLRRAIRMEFTHTRVTKGRRKLGRNHARVSGTLHRTVSQAPPVRIGGSCESQKETNRTLTDLESRSGAGRRVARRRGRQNPDPSEPAAIGIGAFTGAEVRSAWSSS